MDSKNYQKDLEHIRSMMEKSSRFISLSGLSGVSAGIVALLGAFYVYYIFQQEGINYFDGNFHTYTPVLVRKLFFIAIVILFFALLLGYYFTVRKSKKNGVKIWDATTKRLLIHLSIPLVAGGIFCLALQYHGIHQFIAPSMLIFYGLALLNASKFTLDDVKYLGILEVLLGLVSLFFLGWGLATWALGFGVLHIVYGIMMYKKYQ